MKNNGIILNDFRQSLTLHRPYPNVILCLHTFSVVNMVKNGRNVSRLKDVNITIQSYLTMEDNSKNVYWSEQYQWTQSTICTNEIIVPKNPDLNWSQRFASLQTNNSYIINAHRVGALWLEKSTVTCYFYLFITQWTFAFLICSSLDAYLFA